MGETLVEQLVSELSLRFRLLVRALNRLDRLEGERGVSDWLDTLHENEKEIQASVEALVLLALQVVTTPGSLQLLRLMTNEGITTLKELCTATQQERVPVYLELGRLAHAGLVTLELNSETVQPTPLGRDLVAWIDALIGATRERITEWLAIQNTQ